MADRGRNPVRSFRLGAVVLLAMAGTAATLVISEWPLVGQMIAGKAAKPKTIAAHTSMRAVPVSVRSMFMPAEPDPYAPLPDLMTAGSAAESRRIAQQTDERVPLANTARANSAGAAWENMFGAPMLHETKAWQDKTPTERLVDQAVARATARPVASGGADPKVGGELHRFDFIGGNDDGTNQQVSDGDSDAELNDLTVRLDATRMPSITDTPTFDAPMDLRANDRYKRPVPMDVTAGNDATLRLGPNSMLRASANGEAPGVIRDYLDLRLEQVWKLGGASSFSVGWRHMRGIMSNELPEPTVRQDAILLELKIGF